MMPMQPTDVRHKIMLIRTLIALCDASDALQFLRFKGGTCAAMSGFLDRFSVDLDFDLRKGADKARIRSLFHTMFDELGFVVDQESKHELFFVVKYPTSSNQRNSMKISVLDDIPTANQYEPRYLPEIDRTIICQTKETMVSNKLVAPLDRYKKYKTVAGRDIYDMHYFLSHGYGSTPKIITERTGKTMPDFFDTLIDFISQHVTRQTIDEDINTLLTREVFLRVRKSLKEEVLSLLANEKLRWR